MESEHPKPGPNVPDNLRPFIESDSALDIKFDAIVEAGLEDEFDAWLESNLSVDIKPIKERDDWDPSEVFQLIYQVKELIYDINHLRYLNSDPMLLIREVEDLQLIYVTGYLPSGLDDFPGDGILTEEELCKVEKIPLNADPEKHIVKLRAQGRDVHGVRLFYRFQDEIKPIWIVAEWLMN